MRRAAALPTLLSGLITVNAVADDAFGSIGSATGILAKHTDTREDYTRAMRPEMRDGSSAAHGTRIN